MRLAVVPTYRTLKTNNEPDKYPVLNSNDSVSNEVNLKTYTITLSFSKNLHKKSLVPPQSLRRIYKNPNLCSVSSPI